MFPEIEPFATGHLSVSDGNEIYWETSGNPKGKPAIYELYIIETEGHGGPRMVNEYHRAIERFSIKGV